MVAVEVEVPRLLSLFYGSVDKQHKNVVSLVGVQWAEFACVLRNSTLGFTRKFGSVFEVSARMFKLTPR